jgi:muramoyltetrapeptide carboxypeptidase
MADHKIIIPPYLKKGDTIGMVCPAGYMPKSKMKTCIEVLQRDWGFRVKEGKTLGNGDNYFSGTDAERLADLQEMLDDPDVKAVLCARGGYGVGRIIDQVDFRHFRKHPKWLIGFSDITVLHAHIHIRYHIATLHAPMAGAFQDGGYKNEYVQSLRKSLTGKQAIYEAAVHPFNHPGKVSGVLVGGNLALLSHLVGTASDLRTKGKILFVEDVGEQLYNIDRMFYQLKRSGKLDKLAGLVIGGFTDCKDTDRPFGKTAYEIIHDLVKEYAYPVCYGFPVSHEKENYALKVGGTYTLSVSRNLVKLREHI